MSDPMPDSPLPSTGFSPLLPARLASREPDDALTASTRLWLRRLPSGRRPLRLCEQFPRVANRLAFCWVDPAIRAQTLEDLLEDRGGGRQGFPASVVRELQRLREFGGLRLNETGGPPWWRAMVKAVRN